MEYASVRAARRLLDDDVSSVAKYEVQNGTVKRDSLFACGGNESLGCFIDILLVKRSHGAVLVEFGPSLSVSLEFGVQSGSKSVFTSALLFLCILSASSMSVHEMETQPFLSNIRIPPSTPTGLLSRPSSAFRPMWQQQQQQQQVLDIYVTLSRPWAMFCIAGVQQQRPLAKCALGGSGIYLDS